MKRILAVAIGTPDADFLVNTSNPANVYKKMPRALRDAIAADAIFGALLLLHAFL
jgi:hypothetical protein